VGRSDEHAQEAVQDVKSLVKDSARVSAARLDNVNLGDIVVLALWYGTNKEVARQLGDKLNGKVVVDIANPLNSSYDNLATAPDSSSAEEVAKAAPGAKVVKAFNTTYAGTLRAGQVDGQPLDIWIAGDDAEQSGSACQGCWDAPH
jgi:predicted dinucleotide-binding enzyme